MVLVVVLKGALAGVLLASGPPVPIARPHVQLAPVIMPRPRPLRTDAEELEYQRQQLIDYLFQRQEKVR